MNIVGALEYGFQILLSYIRYIRFEVYVMISYYKILLVKCDILILLPYYLGLNVLSVHLKKNGIEAH